MRTQQNEAQAHAMMNPGTDSGIETYTHHLMEAKHV
jgi:hypothetical protein